jgi:tRNA threonylcarbamoyladenosine biosynthesis protein TsaE
VPADRGTPGPAANAGLRVLAEVQVPTAARMRELGLRLAGALRPGDLVVLAGPLGAGKTTLVQGLGQGLGVRGQVTSPTFVIAREHPATGGGPALVHVDAYRLGSRAEVDDLDLDADVARCVTAVEWGEGLVEDLAPGHLLIEITVADQLPGGAAPGDEPRTVRLLGSGERWAAAAGAVSRALSGGGPVRLV